MLYDQDRDEDEFIPPRGVWIIYWRFIKKLVFPPLAIQSNKFLDLSMGHFLLLGTVFG